MADTSLMDHPDDLGAGFSAFLASEGLGAQTVRAYAGQIRRLERWLAPSGTDARAIDAQRLASYMDQVPNSQPSRAHLRRALVLYWQWMGRADGPVKVVRVPPEADPCCKALEEEEATMVVKTAIGWWPQGGAVLAGMYLALRRFEIARMQWERFDAGMEWYTVTGKGDRTARLPVHPMLRVELTPKRRGSSYLFPGRFGGHVTAATVWAWSRLVTETAGVGMRPTHHLRHTALATINDRTGDLRATARFARHRRVQTTMIYTRTTARRLQEVVSALDYLA